MKNIALKETTSFEDNIRDVITGKLSSTKDIVQLFLGLGNIALQDKRDILRDGISAVGGLAKAFCKGEFLLELADDIEKIKSRGDIIETSFSDIDTDNMTEILDFIDSVKTRDSERFRAIRFLFTHSLRASVAEADRILCRQFILITKELRGGDILVLKACYDLLKEKRQDLPGDVHTWARIVADRIGHHLVFSVLNHEDALQSNKLLGERVHQDRSGITWQNNARLTDFGIAYCKFLDKEQSLRDSY